MHINSVSKCPHLNDNAISSVLRFNIAKCMTGFMDSFFFYHYIHLLKSKLKGNGLKRFAKSKSCQAFQTGFKQRQNIMFTRSISWGTLVLKNRQKNFLVWDDINISTWVPTFRASGVSLYVFNFDMLTIIFGNNIICIRCFLKIINKICNFSYLSGQYVESLFWISLRIYKKINKKWS